MIRAGQPPFWRLMADAAGGTVWERDGMQAAIFPVAPDRSVFNSVFYEHGEPLIGALEELAAVYDEAGVRAWTVWVPEADAAVAEALAAAGHLLDASPRDMGMELSELRPPEHDPVLALREEMDMTTLARINEIAYGWAPGEFDHVAAAVLPDFRVYLAELEGETVATAAAWDHGTDCVIEWVATLPEARGRGVSTRLMAHALAEAPRRGLRTTSLQATQLGYPVYERLGYRSFGTVQMWERRKH
jgi:GNAT superfamily N-acetyltransferase